MPTPIDALCTGYAALDLGGSDPIYIGERPATGAEACTVLVPIGGTPDPDLPVERLLVQVITHHGSQETAQARAWEAYQTLHRKAEWALEGWRVMGAFADGAPAHLPALTGQTGPVYRVAFTLCCIMTEEEE